MTTVMGQRMSQAWVCPTCGYDFAVRKPGIVQATDPGDYMICLGCLDPLLAQADGTLALATLKDLVAMGDNARKQIEVLQHIVMTMPSRERFP